MSEGEPESESWPHPLLPWLTGIAVNSTPMVRFAPPGEIEWEIAGAALIHPLLGEDEAQRQILTTYHHSAAALLAVAPAGGSELDGTELHALLFIAAQADPLANALCDAAAYALNYSLFSEFAVATRLPGFLDALKEWAKHFGRLKPFDGKEELQYINRQMVQKEDPCAGFWLTAALRDFSSPKDFMQASSDELYRYKDNIRKKKDPDKKGSSRKPSTYKDQIAVLWVPASLWARSCNGIVRFLEPKAEDGVAAEERVRRDISTELKFGGSHCAKWQQQIEKAGEFSRKNI